MNCEIEFTIKEVVDDHGKVLQEKFYWVRLENGQQAKLAEGDLEQ